MLADFKKRFCISLAVTVPVLFLSPMLQSLLGIDIRFTADRFLLFALSSFIYFYGGWPFLKGLYKELAKQMPGMMTLIALAVSVAYLYSCLVVFGIQGNLFFWELATLIDIMLLGHWIEMRSVMGASRALDKLAELMPKSAHRIEKNDQLRDVPVQQLQLEDYILVRPGEKIPADGKIIHGASQINQAMITGESKPVTKHIGDDVIGGSVNGNAALKIKIEKAGKDSYISQVVKLVRNAQKSKSKAQNTADKAAFWLTIIAVTVGSITLTAWLAYGKQFVFALERMVTVMVITCPHALGLAVPLVVAVITTLAAKNGLLIKNRTPFESARNIHTIVFDKTGTLTKAHFVVTDIVTVEKISQDKILRYAAAIETNSEHTIARGITEKAKKQDLNTPEATNFQALPGKGAKATIDNREIFVGNNTILQTAQVTTTNNEQAEQLAADGKTVVYVAADRKLQGIIALADAVRDESEQAVATLKNMGFEIAMITGDNQTTAQSVARKLNLDNYFAEVLPDKKADKIKQLQQKGKKVAMVGDGVNDAPALAQADLGIAIGAGTDVAVETADVVLVQNDPRNVADIIALSRITHKKMLQNLAWATGYNVIAIPLAAGALYTYGIILPPALGAVIMSLSTIIVAVNAALIHYNKAAK